MSSPSHCYFLLIAYACCAVCVCSVASVTPDSATLWTVAHQAHCLWDFPEEYWSGLPYPPLGPFPTQGLNSCLLHCRWILYPLSHLRLPIWLLICTTPLLRIFIFQVDNWCWYDVKQYHYCVHFGVIQRFLNQELKVYTIYRLLYTIYYIFLIEKFKK